MAVWACGQRSLAAQLAGRYLPATARQPSLLTPELAHQIVEAFTRPGDLVIDPIAGPGIVLTEAAAADRWAAGLIGTDQDADVAYGNLEKALTRRQEGKVIIRRGDNLHLTACLDQYHGRAQLAATRLPDPARTSDPASGQGLGALRGPAYEEGLRRVLAGCAVLLQPGGTLAVVTTTPVAAGVLTDLPGMVIRAAARAGLDYTRHIIAITAMIKDRLLHPWLPNGEHAPRGAHRDHDDVLVFTKRTLP